MTDLIFDPKRGWKYNELTRTFTVSEKEVPFATEYDLLNPKTGISKVFTFTHATGPEFDPNTCWIYESSDGLILSVKNDAKMTKTAAHNYLTAKTQSC